MIQLNTNKSWKLNKNKQTKNPLLLSQPNISFILRRTKARNYLIYLHLNNNTHIYIPIKTRYGFSYEVKKEQVIEPQTLDDLVLLPRTQFYKF